MRLIDIIGFSVLWGIFSLGAIFAFLMLWSEERRRARPRTRLVKMYALGAVFCWLWPVSGLAGLVYWLTSTAFAMTVKQLFVDAFGKDAAK